MGKYPRPSHPPPPPPPTHKSSLQNSPSSEYVSPPLPPKPLRRNSSKATLDKEEFLKHIAVPPPAQPPPPIDYLQTGNNNVRLKSSPKNTSATPLTVGHSCANISSDIVADRGKMLEQIKQGVRLKPVSERLQDNSRKAEKNVSLLSTAKTSNYFNETPLAKTGNCYKRMLDSKLSKTLIPGQTKCASSREKLNITSSTPILISKVTTDLSKWSINRSVRALPLNRDRSLQAKNGSAVNQLHDSASTFVPVPTAFSSMPPDCLTSLSTSERSKSPSRVNGIEEIKRRMLFRTVDGTKTDPAKTIKNSSSLFSSKNNVDDVFVQAMIERRKQILGIDGAEDSSEDNHNEWDDE
ncbi:hypothetical protein DdX_04019 [Ditylenchus destructor]|uniref:WH2 domain-containing protein n=1 Tax=Ditylenchus destructor TaxID=166010 RepID=A0AAD4NFZ5_9BILA|nr:hypothetical protein DdX_04019 [Ditylenchus destructor]